MSLGSLPSRCVTWLSFTSALQEGRAMSQLFLSLPHFCLDMHPALPHTCQRGANEPQECPVALH